MEITPLSSSISSKVKRKKLGTLSCMSLIINKMIGTGIFSIPATIFQYANGNVGMLLSLFAVGSIIIFCGLIIYLEFALNLPFRNGGEKNYLLRVFRNPKGLMGCIYSFQIVLLGFSSGNSYAFGKYVLYAINNKETQDEWLVKLIGVLCITFCIILHLEYPNHGTSLFNFLGAFKVLIFILIIAIGILVALGFIDTGSEFNNFENIWKFDNNTPPSMYSISIAMLEVIYSFKGWENANYVLNEVSDPYHILTIAAPSAVIVTSLLYFFVLISYLIVIPKDEFMNSGVLVAGIFFNKVFGESISSKILPIMISLSNLGNVLVVSFAHSHVNKELADNNYLPFSKTFQKFSFSLYLHWAVTVIVLIAPPSTEIYEFVCNLYIYPGTWINIFITLGLIYLKLNAKREKWGKYNNIDNKNLKANTIDFSYQSIDEDSDAENLFCDTPENTEVEPFNNSMKKISAPFVCIIIFLLANVFLALFPFVPPPSNSLSANSTIPFWCFPVIGTTVLASGAAFFYFRKWSSLYKFKRYGILQPEIKYEDTY